MQASKITVRQVFDKLISMDVDNQKRLSDIDAELETLDEIVSGNGKPGLNERVRLLERDWREARNWMRFLAVAVIGDIVARIMGLI